MRNLKRALSLALASVMLLGMMVVGTSAASFPDVDDSKHNIEAIEVLKAVKVMQGDADTGNFRPDADVSRQEMAVVMAALLGLNTKQYENDCHFTDVADWAKGAVAACEEHGIIAGRGGDVYDGASTVTATEAAAMMLRALGYAYLSDGADDWKQPVVQKAQQISLFSKINASINTPMDRNAVAQLALNTLESTMVTADKDPDIEANGVKIPGKVTYSERLSTDSNINRKINGLASSSVASAYTLELGEYIFDGKLAKNTGSGVQDVFKRPATRWEYEKKEINSFSNEPTRSYTEEVKYKDIYKDLGLSGISRSDLTANMYTNGGDGADVKANLTATNDTKIGGNGVLIEAYREGETVTICQIDTYVLKVSGDYNTKKNELKLEALDNVASLPGTTKATLSADDFEGLDAYKDGDYVLVTVADNKIQTIKAADVVTETVTAYVDGKSVTAGNKYEYNKNYTPGSYSIKDEYVLVLDGYGYVIFADGVDAEDNYVYSADAQQIGVQNNIEADLWFVDGTNEVAKLKDGANTQEDDWFKYEKQSDGSYKLTAVAGSLTGDLTNNKTIVERNKVTVKYDDTDPAVNANNNTTFVILEGTTANVYTGIRNVPTTVKTESSAGAAHVAIIMDGNYAKYVFVEAAADKLTIEGGGASERIYILDTKPVETKDGDTTIYKYKAIKDGEIFLGTNDDDYVVMSSKTGWSLGLFGKLKNDKDERVSSGTKVTDVSHTVSADLEAYKLTKGSVKITGDVLSIGGSQLVLAKDYKLFVCDGNDTDTTTASQFNTEYGTNFTGAVSVALDDGKVIEVYVDKSDAAASGVTPAVGPAAVTEPPKSQSELSEILKGQTNEATFEGVENAISTGLEQNAVITTAGPPAKTTIYVTGTVKGYDSSCTDVDVINSIYVWAMGKTAADAVKNKTMSGALSAAGAGPADIIGFIPVTINGNTMLLIVKDADQGGDGDAASRLGTPSGGSNSGTLWDGDNHAVVPADYLVDISGLKIEK